jgi:hypothetical protein
MRGSFSGGRPTLAYLYVRCYRAYVALSASVLSSAIRAGLLGNPDSQAVDNDALTALCDEIAGAVVAHVTANAVVTVASGIPVATTGTAAAQTGATTAPGTGTVA